MIVRYAIANIEPLDVARAAQAAKLDGTVSGGAYGFGAWGIEPSVIVEFAIDAARETEHDYFVRVILAARNEQAAYKTVDGAHASLLYANGTVTVLA